MRAPPACVGARFPTAAHLPSHPPPAKAPLRARGAESAREADEVGQGKENHPKTEPRPCPGSGRSHGKVPRRDPRVGVASPAGWPGTGVPRGGYRAAGQHREGVEGPARACGPAAQRPARRRRRAGGHRGHRAGGSAAPAPQPPSLREEPAGVGQQSRVFSHSCPPLHHL